MARAIRLRSSALSQAHARLTGRSCHELDGWLARRPQGGRDRFVRPTHGSRTKGGLLVAVAILVGEGRTVCEL